MLLSLSVVLTISLSLSVRVCVDAAGRVYFTQTFQLVRAPLLEWLKPLLAWLTTIDFGTVTYPEAFLRHVQDAGLAVDMEQVLSSHGGRVAKMVVASRE
jgi:hypothetical protein